MNQVEFHCYQAQEPGTEDGRPGRKTRKTRVGHPYLHPVNRCNGPGSAPARRTSPPEACTAVAKARRHRTQGAPASSRPQPRHDGTAKTRASLHLVIAVEFIRVNETPTHIAHRRLARCERGLNFGLWDSRRYKTPARRGPTFARESRPACGFLLR